MLLSSVQGRIPTKRFLAYSRNQHRLTARAVMLPHEPTWATVGLFSAGSIALGAIATASIMGAFQRRNARTAEPEPKRQKLAPPSPEVSVLPVAVERDAAVAEDIQAGEQLEADEAAAATEKSSDDAPPTPQGEPHGVPQSDSVVDLQKLQELEQRVADLNALAELGKVYQDSLALSAQLRNLSSFRLQQDKVLGRGSLAVVQEGEYAGDSVAVKLLPIGSVFAEDSRKEACLALCLHHPNIVRVVGVHLVEVEAKPYLALVQETAPGGDLGWQIEDCDFHTGKNGAASMDVAIKLLLDAARGLAYMHDVDVVHGDVKSRNLLVFWEDDEQSDSEQELLDQAANGTADGAAVIADMLAGSNKQQGVSSGSAASLGRRMSVSADGGDDKLLVWGLKWCDFGVSFRAAETPGGVCKVVTGTPGFRAPEVMDIGWSKAADTYAYGVIAWQLLTGEKPIVYDREWRMHVPNPNIMRVDRSADVPKALADLVWDCGAYMPKDRPSMREVVRRLEEIALQRLQSQEAAKAEASKQQAAAEAAEAQAQAAAKQQAVDQKAAAAAAGEVGTGLSAFQQPQAQSAAAAAAAADEGNTPCPTCNQSSPLPCHGYGGLARAMSVAAREAAAGGAAADAAAAAHYQHMLDRELAAVTAAAAETKQVEQQQQRQSFEGRSARSSLDAGGAAARCSLPGRHHYEVLIQNDDDPITAAAVAHTLEQYESSSLCSKVLAGHPQALQLQHQQQQQDLEGAVAMQRCTAGAGATLRHCPTAPVHSHLLDTAADVAAAAVAAGGDGNASTSLFNLRNTSVPSSPLNITGAVSRSNIELLPAHGPGLVPVSTPAAAAGTPTAAAAVGAMGPPAAVGSGLSGWYLASGSSFKKGMWLEKLSGAAPVGSPNAAAAAAAQGDAADISSQKGPFGSVSSVPPMSPSAAAFLHSPLSDRGSFPDAAAMLPGSFSLQLRREPTTVLPAVAEDEQQEDGSTAAAAGSAGVTKQDTGSGGQDSAAAAARLLRRQETTRRLGTDVLAAAGALSKALSALSSASQALPVVAAAAAAGSRDPAVAAASAGVVGSDVLLTQDFVAAARGLSEALAALLPSAAALADVAPDQGAAAAAAATQAVQGLKHLQGQITSAAAAAAAAAASKGSAQPAATVEIAGAPTGNAPAPSAFASFNAPAAPSIDIPTSTTSSMSPVSAAVARHHPQSVRSDPSPAAACGIPGDNISRSINLGSLFSSIGSFGSSGNPGSVLNGPLLSRRHSVDIVRPSFAQAPAAAAAGVDGGVERSSSPGPVLLRMPSVRQQKSMLTEQLSNT